MPDVSDKLARGFGSPSQKRSRFADADQNLAELERKERQEEIPAPSLPALPQSPGRRSAVKRDIISMPEDEYGFIEQIRARCLDERVVVGKSEAVRIALRAALALSSADLAAYAATLKRVKPGKRPAK